MNKIVKQELNRLHNLIDNSDNILITTHSNPDGDAIGSCLALALILKKIGKKTDIITPDKYPQFLKWIKDSQTIHVYRGNEEYCRSLANNAELILAIDYNDPKRLKTASYILSMPNKPKVLIDHHPDPVNFADLKILKTDLGSSAEIIYYLIKEMNLTEHMDRDIAEALFTGIMTDTGCFSYSCSYPEVYYVVAELLKYGIDKDLIYSRIYDNYSEYRLKLMGYCLYEKMTIIKPYHAAYITLTRDELKRFKHVTGDTEGFVNLPFSIKGIKLTALFIEKKDHVKISFRSRNDFSVNEFSSKYFRGGGHLNAAGGEWDLPLENAVNRFLTLLEKYKNRLK